MWVTSVVDRSTIGRMSLDAASGVGEVQGELPVGELFNAEFLNGVSKK